MQLRVVFVVLGGALSGACSAKSAPSCEKTVELVDQHLGASGGDKLAQCKDDKWSAALRNCLVDARDERDATRCLARHRGLKALEASPKGERAVQGLGKLVKAYYVENAQLPGAAPATPAGDCCAPPNHGTCAPDPALWSTAPWEELGFAVDDPDPFHYAIETTGPDEIVVRAVGDLDCDGQAVTYTLRASVANGNVETAFTAPAQPD